MLSAPYNFVPLSRKVFFPDWADQVSHDVPFKDGLSGEIDCQLKFDSPVYVRNGGPWNADGVRANPQAQAFFSVGNTVLIPGSSLRGVFRSVLEIASFGKMGRADDHRYGVRDLQNRPLYTDRMTETVGRDTYRPRVKAGWLEKIDADNWRIVPCKFARVEQTDLKGLVESAELNDRQDAPAKYRQWGPRLDVAFELEPGIRHAHRRGAITLVYEKASGASLRFGGPGTLVFTGQPSPNKHMEFIFYGDDPVRALPVSPRVKRDFEFIHSEPGTGEPNATWGFWRQRMKVGERVPVFYLGNGVVESFGLALMYRLPYKYSIRQTIEHTSPDHSAAAPDLADVIFGYIPPRGGNVENGLKGRVWFSAAVAAPGTVKQCPVQTTVLGAPKPTFYPNYVEQPSNGNPYVTYMDDTSRIRGWKRYPARSVCDGTLPPPPPRAGTGVQTKLAPLAAGATFAFSMKFHNLRPAELGALVWTLTWGGDAGLRHGFGMGKAAGFGQGRVQIRSAHVYDANGAVCGGWNVQGGCNDFVNLMANDVTPQWAQSVQITQLMAMADPARLSQADQQERLRHMRLDSKNQFVQAKNAKQSLEMHVPHAGPTDAVLFAGLAPTHQAPPAQGVACAGRVPPSTTTAPRQNAPAAQARPSVAVNIRASVVSPKMAVFEGCTVYLDNPGRSLIIAKVNGQEVGRAEGPAGEQLKASLPDAERQRFKTRRELSRCRVEVEVLGNMRQIKSMSIGG